MHDAKARLNALLERVRRGETVVIARRNKPVAELRPLTVAMTPKTHRPLGLAGGIGEIPSAFFEPMKDE